MKERWEIRKLRDVLKVQNGYAFNSKLFTTETGKPLIRIRDIKNGKLTETNFNGSYDKKYEVNAGDLLIGMDGEFGCYEWKGDKALLNQRVCRLQEFNNKLYPKFLFYGINKYLKAIEDVTAFATVKHISSKQIENIEIPLPPLQEQQRIVAILDEVFAAIDIAKANAEQNLKNAKELFESYLQGVFENRGDDWEFVKFEDLCKITRGHNPPKSKFISVPQEGYVRFYQIRDGWADDYAVYVPITPQLHLVEPDEILMVAYRHIGKVFRGVSGAFNVALCKISNKDRNKLDDDYLFYIIPTDIVKGELMKRSERSLIPSMSVQHLKEILIPLPSINEQKHLVQKLNALSKQTQKLQDNYKQKINDLEELKKTVLQKAFNGELISKEKLV